MTQEINSVCSACTRREKYIVYRRENTKINSRMKNRENLVAFRINLFSMEVFKYAVRL